MCSLIFDTLTLLVLRRVIFSLCLWKFDVWAAGKGHKPQAVGHIVELCPQTNLMVGVYLAAALFLNNYKAFFFFFF